MLDAYHQFKYYVLLSKSSDQIMPLNQQTFCCYNTYFKHFRLHGQVVIIGTYITLLVYNNWLIIVITLVDTYDGKYNKTIDLILTDWPCL